VQEEFELPIGTFEEAKKWIGFQREIWFAELPVDLGRIQVFAGIIEDDNVSYWNEDEARRIWGGVIAPPGLLVNWLLPLAWRPAGSQPVLSLCTLVPLPGRTLINAAVETTFERPMYVGDRLNVVEVVEDISPEKRTRAGVGHFVSTLSTYRNQTGAIVATHRNTAFRFEADGGAS
jgi:acyl dehydratase